LRLFALCRYNQAIHEAKRPGLVYPCGEWDGGTNNRPSVDRATYPLTTLFWFPRSRVETLWLTLRVTPRRRCADAGASAREEKAGVIDPGPRQRSGSGTLLVIVFN
jgi:hypothetical protein